MTQASKVYFAENVLSHGLVDADPEITRAETKRLVRKVWDDYFGKTSLPPKVFYGKSHEKVDSASWATADEISIARSHEGSLAGVLHEIAHSMLAYGGVREKDSHGGKYVALLLDIHDKYGNRGVFRKLVAEIDAYGGDGIAVASNAPIRPKA